MRSTGGTSGDSPIRRAARQRVQGRYTTDAKGQRTYHAPEESRTYSITRGTGGTVAPQAGK